VHDASAISDTAVVVSCFVLSPLAADATAASVITSTAAHYAMG